MNSQLGSEGLPQLQKLQTESRRPPEKDKPTETRIFSRGLGGKERRKEAPSQNPTETNRTVLGKALPAPPCQRAPPRGGRHSMRAQPRGTSPRPAAKAFALSTGTSRGEKRHRNVKQRVAATCWSRCTGVGSAGRGRNRWKVAYAREPQ